MFFLIWIIHKVIQLACILLFSDIFILHQCTHERIFMIVSCYLMFKYNVIWLVCNISKQCVWNSGLDFIQRFYISRILMNVCPKYPKSMWIDSWCGCLLHKIMPNTFLIYVFGNNIETFCCFICMQIIGFLSIWVSTIIYFIWAYKTTILLVYHFKLYFSNYLW